MIKPVMQRFFRWLKEHRDDLAEFILLGAALAGAAQFGPPVPAAAILALLVLFVLIPGRKPSPTAPLWQRFTPRWPAIAAVTLGAAALYCFWFGLSWRALAFVPLWVAAFAVWRAMVTHLPRLVRQGWRLCAASRSDALLGEACLVGGIFHLAAAFYPDFWRTGWAPAVFIIAGQITFRALARWTAPALTPTVESKRLIFTEGFFALLIWAGCHFEYFPGDAAHLTVFAWCGLSVAVYRLALSVTTGLADGRAENIRWLLLGAAAMLLLNGFARFNLHGTPDALWYGTMLADMVTQIRSGIFPVWIGQTPFQFNGSIYPLRVAPAFHHLGATLDIVTFHTLGIFALQNLLITLVGIAAIFSAYFSFSILLPRHRSVAFGFAFLFLACPGVLGIAYNTDLFMSWMTVPCLPLVWCATVKSFESAGATRALIVLGAALGLCWWGHSPIALWATLIAGIVQFIRCALVRPSPLAWRSIAWGAAAFLAIAVYPIGSVLWFPPEPGIRADSFQVAFASTIVHFLREVFPSAILPVSQKGRALSDFQLGWSLWALLAVGLLQWRHLGRPSRLLLSLAAALALLVTPIPGVDLLLWNLIPPFVRNTTGNWAMNRLYLLLSTLVLSGCAASAGKLHLRGWRRMGAVGLFALGCSWSALEAAKFNRGSQTDFHPAESAVDALRLENIQITRFAYLIFPETPPRFSHGVMDPDLENRLLSLDLFKVLEANFPAASAAGEKIASGKFVLPTAPIGSYLETDRSFRLEAGRRYLLKFGFDRPQSISGVLQLSGRHFFREYELPEYGGEESFGAGASHSPLLSVLNSSLESEDISLKFFPKSQPLDPNQALPFAQVEQLAYDRSSLPIKLDSWMPYRAHVTSPADAWLETPRMYQRFYRATSNGVAVEVSKSPAGLTLVRVPRGTSEIELSYHAPWLLEFIYGTSLSTIFGLVLWASADVVRKLRRNSLSAHP